MPADIDTWQKSSEELNEFHRKHPVATSEEIDRFYASMRDKYELSSPVIDDGFTFMVKNALIWRPWLVLLAIVLSLIFARPSIVVSMSSGIVVAAMLLPTLGSMSAIYCIAVVIGYSTLRWLFFRGKPKEPGIKGDVSN